MQQRNGSDSHEINHKQRTLFEQISMSFWVLDRSMFFFIFVKCFASQCCNQRNIYLYIYRHMTNDNNCHVIEHHTMYADWYCCNWHLAQTACMWLINALQQPLTTIGIGGPPLWTIKICICSTHTHTHKAGWLASMIDRRPNAVPHSAFNSI